MDNTQTYYGSSELVFEHNCGSETAGDLDVEHNTVDFVPLLDTSKHFFEN